MIRARQALYGEKNKGHALLACTPGSEGIANAIRSHTDRAADKPAQMELPTYLTGLRVGDAFAVMRTALDPEASRSGMVLTHALFVSAAECGEIDDVGHLIGALPDRPQRGASLEPVLIGQDPLPPPDTQLIEPLLAALLAGAPLVAWLGEEGFEDAVRSVWRVLGPSKRASFAFGFAFGPKGTIGDRAASPVLMRTPHALRPRWSDHVVLDPSAPATTDGPTSPAVAAILNRAGGEIVQRLQEAVEVDELALSDYRTLEIAAPRFAAFESGTAEPTDLRTLARAIGRLAPRPDQALGLKRRLLAMTCRQIDEAADVLGLRNLDLRPYPDSSTFWPCVASSWAASATSGHAQPGDAAALIAGASRAEGSEWAGPVLDAASGIVASHPSMVWSWWEEDSHLIPVLLNRSRPDVEPGLVAAAPATVPSAAALRSAARANGLFVLHALAVAGLSAPVEAFNEQLALGDDPRQAAALHHLADVLGPGPTVQAAVEAYPAPKLLLGIAAMTVVESPGTMKSADPASPAWRAVWSQAIREGAEVVNGMEDPTGARNAVLSAVSADSADPDASTLAEAFSQSELADLADYPDRANIWSHLDDDLRSRFLNATAEGWVARAATGDPDWQAEPPVLDAALASDRGKALFDPLRVGGVVFAVEAFSHSGALSEDDFVRWVRGLPRRVHLSQLDAERIGSVARTRGWRRGAQEVMSAVEWERRDLRPALTQVFDLLEEAGRRFARILGVGGGPSTDDWWDELSQLARELLSTPDALDTFWELAGGKEEDLQSRGTNASRAAHAVGLVRKGNVATPTAFVRALRSEYPSNQRLARIESAGRDLGIINRAL